MLIIKERNLIISSIEILINNCDGVIMTAKPASLLHNFAIAIQGELRQLGFGVENGGIEEDVEHD